MAGHDPAVDHEFTTALAYLDSYTNRGVIPGLERIRWLCGELGHPERAAPAVHITGTNGKGSTARLTSALLGAHGARVGLYTSPHLEDIVERIVVGGAPISHERFAALMGQLGPLFDRVTAEVNLGPSHFEILTTLALVTFAEAGVDASVVEVGLGGRWDTTNVIDGRVAAITNVDLDHTHYLGARREDHAFEKAGIIKAGAIAVVGETDPALTEIIAARCQEVDADPWWAGEEFALVADQAVGGGRRITVRTPGALYRDVVVPFHGAHQARNAAVALAATEAFLGGPVPDELVRSAWARLENPGRFEIFESDPPVVVDVAHNPHGVAALIDALLEMFPRRGWVVVMGINPDKDAPGMLERLAPHVRALIATEAAAGSGMPASVLAKTAQAAGIAEVHAVNEPAQALGWARGMAGPEEVLICTGSHYWLGGIRRRLSGGNHP